MKIRVSPRLPNHVLSLLLAGVLLIYWPATTSPTCKRTALPTGSLI
jgi:hypothetical protein